MARHAAEADADALPRARLAQAAAGQPALRTPAHAFPARMSAIVFWVCIALILYTYVLYPLLVRLLARARGRTPRLGMALPAITIAIAAHNEATRIEGRVRDVLAQDYPPENLRVIVVDDGSTDGTAAAAAIDDPRVRVLNLEHNQGKAVALNAAVAEIDG